MPQHGSTLFQLKNVALYKGAFRDAIALRYGCNPYGLPSTSTYGRANGVDHALSCPRGGFIIKRHNEIRDVTTSLLKDVTSTVKNRAKSATTKRRSDDREVSKYRRRQQIGCRMQWVLESSTRCIFRCKAF